MSNEPVRLKVFRFDPASDRAPRYESYQVPWKEGLLLLPALKYIRDNLDETLAFRDYCCGCSWCASCIMTVDGKGVRTCSRPLKPGESLVVEPMWGFPVIQDLAVDFGTTIATPDGIFQKMEGTVLRKEKRPAKASHGEH
jgi:succinate dehydrogenase/fumarate reductase-like Fe-S protein